MLPRKTRQCPPNTLVLDLDETLVHSNLEGDCSNLTDFSFPVHFNDMEHIVHVQKRPHLAAFMVGRCKLNPNLKAPGFKGSTLMKRILLST